MESVLELYWTNPMINFTKLDEEFDKEFPPFVGIGAQFPIFDTTPNREHVRNFLHTAITKTLQTEHSRIREVVRGMEKTGYNGEDLPFENSPDIYGNKRVEAFKKGYNQALNQLEEAIGL